MVVPDLLTDDELDGYATAVTSAVKERTSTDGRSLAEKSRYEQSFIQWPRSSIRLPAGIAHPGIAPRSD